MGNKRARDERKKDGNSLEDWVTSLARNEVSETNSTKAERIAKRLVKKRRREEIKQEKRNAHPKASARTEDNVGGFQREPSSAQNHSVTSRISKQSLRLNVLSQKVEDRVTLVKEKCMKAWQKPYSPVPIIPKKRRRQREDCQQPRPSDYGGIGLARASLWISLDDPSWQPKLEEEFAEHVTGFFGKNRTKAMKKQLDGKMLWRQLMAEKQGKEQNAMSHPGNQKINGKKLSAMTSDERIEAMIRAGMI